MESIIFGLLFRLQNTEISHLCRKLYVMKWSCFGISCIVESHKSLSLAKRQMGVTSYWFSMWIDPYP